MNNDTLLRLEASMVDIFNDRFQWLLDSREVIPDRFDISFLFVNNGFDLSLLDFLLGSLLRNDKLLFISKLRIIKSGCTVL
jgi:hypothetical protein